MKINKIILNNYFEIKNADIEILQKLFANLNIKLIINKLIYKTNMRIIYWKYKNNLIMKKKIEDNNVEKISDAKKLWNFGKYKFWLHTQ